MKRTLFVLAAAVLLSPSAMRAQSQDAIQAHQDAQQKHGTQELLKLMTEGNGDGKRPIVVLDSVRADEKAVTHFVIALNHQQVFLGPGGVRVLAGDSKEAEKYGAKPGDRVIIVSTSLSKP